MYVIVKTIDVFFFFMHRIDCKFLSYTLAYLFLKQERQRNQDRLSELPVVFLIKPDVSLREHFINHNNHHNSSNHCNSALHFLRDKYL